MEKSELWLIWRAEDRASKNRRRYRIGTLTFDEKKNRYEFTYDYAHDFLAAKETGFTYYPGFMDTSEGKVYMSEGELFPSIASRLPKQERDDYLDLLNRYGLDKNDGLFKQLGVTKGRQVTDDFEFVPAFRLDKIEFEVAGVSHRREDELRKCVKNGILIDGAKLRLALEPDNEYDANAIRILLPTADGEVLLGYVPRYYSAELAAELRKETRYSAIVARVDLSSAVRDEKIAAKIRLMFE